MTNDEGARQLEIGSASRSESVGNLAEDYQAVSAYVLRYHDFAQRIMARTTSLKGVFTTIRAMGFGRTLKDGLRMWTPPSSHSALLELQKDLHKTGVSILVAAMTESERADTFSAVMLDQFPLHALACDVESRFPSVNFETILELHKSQPPVWQNLFPTLKVLIGGIWAVGVLFLKSVPESVVRRTKINYANYELAVFGCTVFLCVYAFFLFGWLRRVQSRHLGYHQALTKYLQYLALHTRQQSRSAL